MWYAAGNLSNLKAVVGCITLSDLLYNKHSVLGQLAL